MLQYLDNQYTDFGCPDIEFASISRLQIPGFHYISNHFCWSVSCWDWQLHTSCCAGGGKDVVVLKPNRKTSFLVKPPSANPQRLAIINYFATKILFCIQLQNVLTSPGQIILALKTEYECSAGFNRLLLIATKLHRWFVTSIRPEGF